MSGYPKVGEQFGRYRITGVIGEGGMGVVLAAILDGLDRKVALKILSQDLARDPAYRRRFNREAAALASLYSPHIVDIYDYGEQDGSLFIATRLVEGDDLETRLERDGALGPAQALGLVAQVASAVADAHEAGVIHRDIKPSNVLLHDSSHGDRFAYLCDFGIAHTRGEDRTDTTGGVLGTAGYLAPERSLGADATVASDIYALGCLLWTTLTGRPPYRGTALQVAMQHTSDPIPQYAGEGPAADAINSVLLRSMAKSPEDRYPSAGHLRAALLKAQQRATQEPVMDGDTPVDSSEPYIATRRLAPASGQGRRRIGPWLLVTVALLVVVVAAAIGAQAWTQDVTCPDGSSAAAASDCPDPTDGAAADDESLTCWDGEKVASVDDCRRPVGLDGLRWVFPSFEGDFDSCIARPPKQGDPRRQSWNCLVGGGERGDSITYAEWGRPAAARAFFEDTLERPPAEFVQGSTPLVSWYVSQPGIGADHHVTITYEALPFSTSLHAETLTGLRRLCTHVKLRSLHSFGELSPRCPGRGDVLTGSG